MIQNSALFFIDEVLLVQEQTVYSVDNDSRWAQVHPAMHSRSLDREMLSTDLLQKKAEPEV